MRFLHIFVFIEVGCSFDQEIHDLVIYYSFNLQDWWSQKFHKRQKEFVCLLVAGTDKTFHFSLGLENSRKKTYILDNQGEFFTVDLQELQSSADRLIVLKGSNYDPSLNLTSAEVQYPIIPHNPYDPIKVKFQQTTEDSLLFGIPAGDKTSSNRDALDDESKKKKGLIPLKCKNCDSFLDDLWKSCPFCGKKV